MKRLLLISFALILALGTWRVTQRTRATPNASLVAPKTAEAPAAMPPLAQPGPSAANLPSEIADRLLAEARTRADAAERESFLQSAVQGVPRALYARLAEYLGAAVPESVEAELLRAIVLRWATGRSRPTWPAGRSITRIILIARRRWPSRRNAGQR